MNAGSPLIPTPAHQLTEHGRKVLRVRLQELEEKRRDILGRLRESAEQQAPEPFDLSRGLGLLQQIDDEMARLDMILSRALHVQATGSPTVCVGANVTIRRGEHMQVVVPVESIEADPANGFISVESPLGKLLMGKQSGDHVVLHTQRSRKDYEIVAIG